MITIYKNIKDIKNPKYISVDIALERIKEGKSQKTVEAIRKTEDSKERAKLKQQLPSVCFSGKFTERKDANLSKHSGFVVLDFDHLEDVTAKKKVIADDEYTYAVWISPSGDGLKALIQIPPTPEDHEAHYLALIEKYPELDTTSKNLSRVCYESFDSEIYINKDSKVWTGKKIEEKLIVKTPTAYNRSSNGDIFVKRVLDKLRESGGVNKHEHLLKAGFLAGGFIAAGDMDESDIRNALLDELGGMGVDSMDAAEKTMDAAIEEGKRSPIEQAQNYNHTPDNKKSVVIDDSKLMSNQDSEAEWIQLAKTNTIPQGYDIGSEHFDNHYRLKPQTLVGIFGVDNTGKTTFHHFISTCYSKRHKDVNWFLICKENQNAAVRQKIMELYLGKSLSSATNEEFDEAKAFAYDKFDILEDNFDINMENFFEVIKKVFSKKHYFAVFVDPYNSIQHEQTPNKNYKFLDALRSFQKEYNMSFHLSMHISTEKARNYVYGDKETIFDFEGKEIAVSGQFKIPRKNFVEGGQPIANKLDDIIIVHRIQKMIELRNYTLISIDKVKEEQTGGMVSFEEPIMFYKQFGFDSFLDKHKINPLIEARIKDPITISPPPEYYDANKGLSSERNDEEWMDNFEEVDM